jgi:hypothetical protein
MIDLRGILTNWFKNPLCPSIRLSRLWAQGVIGLKLVILKRVMKAESIATVPPFRPIEGHNWVFKISSQ